MTAAAAWLAEPLVTAAWCWRLVRRDGVVVALTSHDRDLFVDGQIYRAAPGMRPSRIEQNDRIESQSMDLSGAISAAAIRADDIAAGRWDGARLTVMLADWAQDNSPVQLVAQGQLGSVVRQGHAFSVELTGPIDGLDQPVGPATSPGCRAALGDRDCRVALAGLTRQAQVIAIDGRRVRIAGSMTGDDFAQGRLRWLNGPATGLTSAIAAQDDDWLMLAELPTIAPPLPARVELREGCDKRLESCATRFANAANFRGEAHLPGFDLLTRYPGG